MGIAVELLLMMIMDDVKLSHEIFLFCFSSQFSPIVHKMGLYETASYIN